ncbi:hypothetical protein AAFF_G00340500, partial [Aldrovandia affinis]
VHCVTAAPPCAPAGLLWPPRPPAELPHQTHCPVVEGGEDDVMASPHQAHSGQQLQDQCLSPAGRNAVQSIVQSVFTPDSQVKGGWTNSSARPTRTVIGVKPCPRGL